MTHFPGRGPLVLKAELFVEDIFSGSVRKGVREPTVFHSIRVGELLAEHEYSDEVVASGLLHDVNEDAQVPFEYLEKEFGRYVAELVHHESEPDKSWPWEKRKEHTIEHLKTAPLEALAIACSDKTDNIRSFRRAYEIHGNEMWKAFKRGPERQHWYHNAIINAVAPRAKHDPRLEAMLSVYKNEFGDFFREYIK